MSLGGALLLSLYKGVAVTTPSAEHSSRGTCSFLPSTSTQQQELDAGNCIVAGKLPLLLLVAAAAKQADEQVPGALLQHRHHVLLQHTAGRSIDSDDREALISVGCD